MVKITDGLQSLCNKIFRWIPQAEPTPDQLAKIQIVAHRGCWNQQEKLENTMAAFLEALRHDIWAIEFDIRWTSDNVPVVHHDRSTARVFKKELVIEETAFEKLRQEIPQIPSFEELVSELGGKIHFMIELKTMCSPRQVEILQEILKSLKPVEDFHFMSLELQRFAPFHSYNSQTFVSIARTNIKEIFNKSLEMKLGGFTGQYLLLTDSMKQSCQHNNIKVGTGFPDSKNLFYREAHRDVDWIFTNHAPLLARLKKKQVL